MYSYFLIIPVNPNIFIVNLFTIEGKYDNSLTEEEFENIEDFKDVHDCPICYYKKYNNKKLPCNHIFCNKCIENWLIKNSNSCPLCRKIVK